MIGLALAATSSVADCTGAIFLLLHFAFPVSISFLVNLSTNSICALFTSAITLS